MKDNKYLLVIDIGNSQTKVGVYKEKELIFFSSQQIQKIDFSCIKYKINNCIISSVAAEKVLNKIINNIKSLFNIEPLLLDALLDIPLLNNIRKKYKSELGSDRLANIVAAYYNYFLLYKTGLIIIDLGTTTTFDILDKSGNYIGGLIVPGFSSSASTLWKATAKLPKIELNQINKNNLKLIGEDTLSCMISGIIFGYTSLIEGLILRIKKELDEQLKVILTGGFADILSEHLGYIDYIAPYLTLEGLRICAHLANSLSRRELSKVYILF